MKIVRIEIKNFRNLSQLQLNLGGKFNIFYGNNGSGKTSFIESIYYLGVGRSFRTHLLRRIISYDQEQLLVFARVQDEHHAIIPIGMERSRDGSVTTRVAGETVQTQVQVAQLLPLQLIHSGCYCLLESGPKYRRQFMDWGMFHVEPSFLSSWQRLQRALKQRNAALKRKSLLGREQIQLWDRELEAASFALHAFRKNYIGILQPVLSELLESLLGRTDIIVEYYPGWDIERSLMELLQEHLERDLQYGYTGIGPQKADLRCKIGSIPVQDVLSRGQQKLFICALRLAQGLLLYQQTGKNCVYLIDDLASELDSERKQRIAKVLRKIHAQVFITGVNREDLTDLLSDGNANMFHVKHGEICQDE